MHERLLDRLVDPRSKRDIVICRACAPHVKDDVLDEAHTVRLCDYVVDPLYTRRPCQGSLSSGQDQLDISETSPTAEHDTRCEDQALPVIVERWHVHLDETANDVLLADGAIRTTPVLGFTVQEFASPVAQLSDQEEMVISLVHPLVQVYTLPRAGQLAYVGHVCNFRQQVTRFFTSLPILPQDMPFVMVRPRTVRNRESNEMPFKVNVQKLRAAYLWLKENNPYYRHITWDTDAAHAWSHEDVSVGTTKEEYFLSDQPLPVAQEHFGRWMQEAEAQQEVGAEAGFAMGRRLLEVLTQQRDETTTKDSWSLLRAQVADVQNQCYIRAASALQETCIAVLLYAHGALTLPTMPDLPVAEVATFLAEMPQPEWADDLLLLYSALHTVRAVVSAEEPEVQLGGFSAAPPAEDLTVREETLEKLAAAVEALEQNANPEKPDDPMDERTQVVGDGDGAPVSDSADAKDAPDRQCGKPRERERKLPRVGPPPVEDEPGQAIREDTPGYIAQAFPRPFPHGTGDFHCECRNF